MTTQETQFMQRAIELAKKALGKTSPNPVVGAVLVQEGKIIGEGYHRKAGTAHAEIRALRDAEKNGHSVKGATLYITLEPCCHHGQTPPCTEALIEARVAHVVMGMIDPFPKVHGKGRDALQDAGIEVSCLTKQSTLAQEIHSLNQSFFKWAESGLPYITLKAGMSLDGKIATRSGDSKWITSEKARKDARIERSMCDAVLVGAGTVRADDPELGPHGTFVKKPLLRIVMDPTLTLDLSQRVFRDAYVFVATTNQASEKDTQRFEQAGIAFKSFGQKKISLKRLLQFLGKLDVQHIYVEGGSGTHGYFCDDARIDQLLVDRVLFYVEPVLLGGKEATPVVGGRGVKHVVDGIHLIDTTTQMVGGTIKVEGFVNIY